MKIEVGSNEAKTKLPGLLKVFMLAEPVRGVNIRALSKSEEIW